MSKYTYLLWDIDGTILNFSAAEKKAIETLFLKYGFGELKEESLKRYVAINNKYWQALERKEMSKPQILVGRFVEFFETEGLDITKAAAFNEEYQVTLGDTIVFCDDSKNLLLDLKGKYVLSAITNGTKRAQSKKLKNSGLDQIFDYIFISEDVGAEKPSVEYFDKVISDMKIVDRKKALVIGDSLTSDIRGGNNAKMDTCWYNPCHKEKDIDVTIDYEISSLSEIFKIIE